METEGFKNKVTVEDVKANMQDVIVRTLDDFGKPCTYVTVRMKNGFMKYHRKEFEASLKRQNLI